MKVSIERQKTNRLYTEGRLVINDDPQTYTVESTEIMLPAGEYLLKLVTKNAHRRELEIFSVSGEPTCWRIGIEQSWIGSKKTKTIVIGQQLIPGALYKATPDYQRIIKRLEKCKARNEAINLTISDNCCKETTPISHWTVTRNPKLA